MYKPRRAESNVYLRAAVPQSSNWTLYRRRGHVRNSRATAIWGRAHCDRKF